MTNEVLPAAISNNGAYGVHTGSEKAPLSRGYGLRMAVKRPGTAPYDELLWRLRTGEPSTEAGTLLVGVVGSEHQVGATTIAASLAIRASELRMGPVLLVETDVERPRLREMWKLPAGPGLVELLHEAAAFADCTYAGPGKDLRVVPSSSRPTKRVLTWEPDPVSALLAEAAADHALVLIDLPAADQLHHAMELARQIDQVLLVVRAECTRQQQAARVAAWLSDCGVPLTGAILNRKRRYLPKWFERWC